MSRHGRVAQKRTERSVRSENKRNKVYISFHDVVTSRSGGPEKASGVCSKVGYQQR